MSINRSDFQRSKRSSVDADAQLLVFDPSASNDDTFVISIEDIGLSVAAASSQYAKQAETVLAPWYRAVAGRDGSKANAVVIGDSIDIAFKPTTLSHLWPRQVQRQLRAALPTVTSTGFGRGFIGPSATGAGSTITWPTSFGGTTVSAAGFGPNIDAYELTNTRSITWTVNGTHVDVIYTSGGSTGTLSVSVDGGAAVTQSTVTGSIINGQKFRVSLGASGSHTVLVTATTSTVIYVGGIIEYDGDQDAGIFVHACGNAGDTATSWNTAATTAPAYTSDAIAGAFNPDLLIIKLGINDRVNLGTTAALFAVQLETLITSLVNKCVTRNSKRPPTLIVASFEVTSANASPWSAFVQAMKDVAAAAPTERLCLDLSARMPAVAADTSSLYDADAVHPNNKGHAMIADAVARLLIPR